MKANLLLALMLCGLCLSCNSKPTPTSPFSTSSRSAQADVRHDYTKPYLTDDKVSKLIESMKEEHNPFEMIFKQGGQINTPAEMQSRMQEFNAFARKYGFQDYEDYMAVWGRVVVGETQIWADSMKQSTRKMIQDSIDNAKKQLQAPNLNPEMRKAYEEQVSGGEKSLADMDKPSKNSLNDSDLALVKKYLPQLQEAAKKYQSTGKG